MMGTVRSTGTKQTSAPFIEQNIGRLSNLSVRVGCTPPGNFGPMRGSSDLTLGV
jgi:hypothetical protein